MISKKQTTILTIISIATLFFAIVGATFAYFTITVKGNEEASSVMIRTAFLGQVIFEDGQEIKIPVHEIGNAGVYFVKAGSLVKKLVVSE